MPQRRHPFSADSATSPDTIQAPLLTRPQLASMLGTAVSTLENWARVGIGPRVTKIGPRQVRYHKEDVRAFLEAGQKSGGNV